jgi:hypothetical protein
MLGSPPFFRAFTQPLTQGLRASVSPAGSLVVLIGANCRDHVIDFDALIRNGMIDGGDGAVFHRTDVVEDAFRFVTSSLTQYALDERGTIL